MRSPDPMTLRRAWRSLAENAAAAACDVQTPEPGDTAAVVRRTRFGSIVQAGSMLRSARMAPGEGACASSAAWAFLDLVMPWSHPAVSDERRAQLAPFVAAGAGVIEILLDEAADAARRQRPDLYE